MKMHERTLIAQGWRDGRATNFLRGGEGFTARWVSQIPHMAILIALGYNTGQIARTLKITVVQVDALLKKFFGGLKNGRKFLLDPLIEKLKGYGIKRSSIYEGFKEYFHSSHRIFDIDADHLVILSLKGYNMDQLVPELWKAKRNLGYEIESIIASKFPNLPMYIKPSLGGRRALKTNPTYEDLKHHLMANLILVYTYQGLTPTQIATKFKTPSKPNGLDVGVISDILHRVFGLKWNDLRKIVNPKVLPYIMLERTESNAMSFFDIINTFSGKQISTATYQRLRDALGNFINNIRAGSHTFTGVFQSMRPNSALARRWAKLALVGPLLEMMIRVGCSITEIRDSLSGIYSNEAQLVEDLQMVFGGLPATFFHSNFLGLSHYESILPPSFIRFIDTAFNLYTPIS